MISTRVHRFRYFVLGLVGIPFLLAILLLVTAELWLPAIGHWLAQPYYLGRADVIVVLSGGGPERLMHGIALYQQGLAPELWYTGDVPISTMTSFTDGQFARDFAVAQGVPAEAIHLLATTSTWEDGQEIAARIRQEDIHSVLVVTHWYHSRRALCVIRKQLAGTDVQLFHSTPPAPTCGPDNWWRYENGLLGVVNEIIKFGFYWRQYGLVPWHCEHTAGGGRQIMLEVAGLGFTAWVLSYLGVGGLRGWAERRQILDIPNERSSHARPTPRGGGLAIVVVTLGGWLLYTWLNPGWPWLTTLACIAGAVLVAAVSWLDDLRSLPNRVRFAAHSMGAILAILGFGYWCDVSFPFLDQLRLGWLGLPITFLWIVGLTNAYNFMDGIDGIAGGQAVVAGLGWAALGWLSDQPLIGVLGLLLATSSLGFLGHNWPPARIFMGDVGSAFLGYTFAVLPIIAAQSDSRLALAGVLLVWPFVFDTGFTFLRRLRNGENVFAAHRSHLYQRLIIAGYAHRFVTLFYAGLAVVGVILALAWSRNVVGSRLVVVLSVPLLCIALWTFVNRQEHKEAL